MVIEREISPQRALLVGVYRSGEKVDTCEEHLNELARLCDTYGMSVVGREAAPLRSVNVRTFLGSGKLEELRALADDLEADTVLFDDELTPSQQRNLEKVLGRNVMERTEVILGVFAQHAHTREAQLQVELAQIEYQFPRLKRLWTHLARQRGGSAFLKGEGETQIELDRRMLSQRRDRLHQLLKEVKANREVQRGARQRHGVPTFAIVGYTNAGKSTLLNALTDAGVLAEDQLFATLDTTTRHYILPNNQKVLLTDTVGFIRKIPHTLVQAFHGTLEEAVYADVLLHLIDASHPNALEQARTARAVLAELGASDKPMVTVLNKVDRVIDPGQLRRLSVENLKSVAVSARTHEGFDRLCERMMAELAELRRVIKLRIPQKEYALVSEILRLGKVYYQEYEGNDILLRAEVPVEIAGRVASYQVDDDSTLP